MIAYRGLRSICADARWAMDTTVSFSEAIHQYNLHTLVGVAGIALLISVGSLGHAWLLAVLLGLLLSVPLEMILSSVRLGRQTRNAGLFLAPEETKSPTLLLRRRLLRQQMQNALAFHNRTDIFRRVVLDTGLNDMHIALLQAQGVEQRPWNKIESIAHVALNGGPEHLRRRERLMLLSNTDAMAWLHREVWKRWKV